MLCYVKGRYQSLSRRKVSLALPRAQLNGRAFSQTLFLRGMTQSASVTHSFRILPCVFLTFPYPVPVPKNCVIFIGCNFESRASQVGLHQTASSLSFSSDLVRAMHARGSGHLRVSRFARRTTEKRETARSLGLHKRKKDSATAKEGKLSVLRKKLMRST